MKYGLSRYCKRMTGLGSLQNYWKKNIKEKNKMKLT
jgi:hypothetical protein